MTKIADLGWCVARSIIKPHTVRIDIISPSDASETAHVPAESVAIHGLEGIKELERLCADTIRAYTDLQP